MRTLGYSSVAPSRRYKKERLAEHHWHKVVLSPPLNAMFVAGYDKAAKEYSTNLNTALDHCNGPVMHTRGGTNHILFVADDEDMVWLMMKLGLSHKEMRGKGDWATAKYHCAQTNRMN